MSTDVQRIISVSLNKIIASRSRKGGISLHRNLLVAGVLMRAKDAYIAETVAQRREELDRLETSHPDESPKPIDESLNPSHSVYKDVITHVDNDLSQAAVVPDCDERVSSSGEDLPDTEVMLCEKVDRSSELHSRGRTEQSPLDECPEFSRADDASDCLVIDLSNHKENIDPEENLESNRVENKGQRKRSFSQIIARDDVKDNSDSTLYDSDEPFCCCQQDNQSKRTKWDSDNFYSSNCLQCNCNKCDSRNCKCRTSHCKDVTISRGTNERFATNDNADQNASIQNLTSALYASSLEVSDSPLFATQLSIAHPVATGILVATV